MSKKRKISTRDRYNEKKNLQKEFESKPENYDFREISSPVVLDSKMKWIFEKNENGEFRKINGFLICDHPSCKDLSFAEKVSCFRNFKIWCFLTQQLSFRKVLRLDRALNNFFS